MKILNKVKLKTKKYIQFFGVTIYSLNFSHTRKVKRILGNAITVIKVKPYKKIIRIFGIPIFRKTKNKHIIKIYILNWLIKTQDLNEIFNKNYQKDLQEYETVFIFTANSGEVYLFLTYLFSPFMEKMNGKKPLFIATKEYHIDIIQALCPNIPYLLNKKIEKEFDQTHTVFDGKHFIKLFTTHYFRKVERTINKNSFLKAHYFHLMLNELQLDIPSFTAQTVFIADKIKQAALTKANSIGLDLNNFVLFCPEASSCKELPTQFWFQLSEALKKQKLDIFFNIAKVDSSYSKYAFKMHDMPFSEIFVLATYAKGIVALRSGLIEFLLQANNAPIFALYTDFKARDKFGRMNAEQVLSGFGINQIPCLDPNRIFEFNMTNISQNRVIETIAVNLLSSTSLN